MKVYLIRHGRTTGNENFLYCGWDDTPLSEGGIEQLKEMVNTKEYPSLFGLKVYTSGLTRTEQTLKIIYGDVEHTVLEDFKEMYFGDFEGKSYEQMKDDEAFQKWCEGDNLANVCPNGESAYQMANRVLNALAKLVEANEDCLIVCHGGPIAAIAMYFFPDDEKEWFNYQPSNGEGYVIEFINGKADNIKRIPY